MVKCALLYFATFSTVILETIQKSSCEQSSVPHITHYILYKIKFEFLMCWEKIIHSVEILLEAQGLLFYKNTLDTHMAGKKTLYSELLVGKS